MSKKQAYAKYMEFREAFRGTPRDARQDIMEMLKAAYASYMSEKYDQSTRISMRGLGAINARKGFIKDTRANMIRCKELLDKGRKIGVDVGSEAREVAEIEFLLRKVGVYD